MDTEKMMNVVFYARVSTEEEGQLNALKTQIEMIEEYIESQPNWFLIDKYIDEGKSGTTTKGRYEYNRLYDDLMSQKFDIVIIKDETRLSRDVLSWYQFIDRLAKYEKKLFFLNDRSFYRPDDALLMGVRAIVASQYSRDLSKKSNMAQKQRMKKGRVVTNGRIWGYDQKDGRLIINEKQAEVVKFVFERYVDGLGFRKIQQELEANGIKSTNGTPFAMTTLKRMIKNEKYKGTLICNKRHKDFESKKISNVPESEWVIHENSENVPAIVSVELWEEANVILSQRRTKRSQTHGHITQEQSAGHFRGGYTYSGLIKCGKCGRPYWHQKYSSMKFDLWQCSSYRMFGKNSEQGCNNTHVYMHVMDMIVRDRVFEFLKNKDEHIKNLINALSKVLENNNYDDNIKKLMRDKTKLENNKKDLLQLFYDKVLSKEEFIKEKTDLDQELISIEDRLKSFVEKNKEMVDRKQRLLNIHSLLNVQITSPADIDEELIKSLVKEILVKSDSEIVVVIDGGFQGQLKRADTYNYIYADVSSTGQDRLTYRGISGKILRIGIGIRR